MDDIRWIYPPPEWSDIDGPCPRTAPAGHAVHRPACGQPRQRPRAAMALASACEASWLSLPEVGAWTQALHPAATASGVVEGTCKPPEAYANHAFQ
jgi:hypothetical protein